MKFVGETILQATLFLISRLSTQNVVTEIHILRVRLKTKQCDYQLSLETESLERIVLTFSKYTVKGVSQCCQELLRSFEGVWRGGP